MCSCCWQTRAQHSHGAFWEPVAVPVIRSAIALVRKIRWFRGRCMSKSKFHVTVGHTTVMAVATFFGAKELLGRFGSTNETTTGEASDCPVVAEGTDSGVVAGAAAGAAAGAGAGAGAGAAGDASIEMAAPDGYSRTSLGGMAKENIPVAEYDWDARYDVSSSSFRAVQPRLTHPCCLGVPFITRIQFRVAR